ncbi:type III-B CRISPR-associated protein Cas10/Cmr2 [Romeria aff. gracilis LEGE 07310]|uniref:Type III-B CRISPR-associated protein Cas10/Cmr2 n=1 Tax=Vasconcelosia minhoensis LEGE 07310 TaxID=915328 RepID=A0A8J7APQ0_9CYAN|nr:type III-B CRISPR-associated protein Cas10/Cmr2 [Romeria gracilis]MBE9079035.1 type III-B CRISPR-associated protein Cas10/Cmr2 [Romeria aff. gracilis LEGE 07310]
MHNRVESQSIQIAIAWCLAWGDQAQPQVEIAVLYQMRQAMLGEGTMPEEMRSRLEQVRQLDALDYPQTLDQLQALADQYPELWKSRLGLVYGGATKIKQYVFEASKLQDIRGASALLDRINLIDLPAFFNQPPESQEFEPQFSKTRQWLDRNSPARDDFQSLTDVLIPELIIYSTGGNILAFCPAAYVHELSNLIEKRYTEETLTANSCAVGETFRFLELRFGLLRDPIEETFWLGGYQKQASKDLVKAYYGEPEPNPAAQFERRKSFNELVGKLATRFNQRRSGHDQPAEDRPSRRYPPLFETHPYVRRDGTDRRSAVYQAKNLPGSPWFSETTARKRLVGQKAKREDQSDAWYRQMGFDWEAGNVESWVQRYEKFLADNPELKKEYNSTGETLQEARSLREIGNASQGFVAYIYADGNNMGGYIQNITTADSYQRFSQVVSEATEQSVYQALARHLDPHELQGINDAETQNRDGKHVHPFEILTIGGDDVMLVVPANKALAISQTISEEFEQILLALDPSLTVQPEPQPDQQTIHRYSPSQARASTCELSMSAGVLITAENTPIYYAENLTNQLLKSAKKKAKQLKQKHRYSGGTIDFLVMKSVTMLTSKVSEFRESALVFGNSPKLKLYGAPYTLHEVGGLIETAKALKAADFPRSQLYQIRSLLERGKHTAMLNYRYFWSRLDNKAAQQQLKRAFEQAWCEARTNNGNLVPWMCVPSQKGKSTYETIWRELIDLYPFIDEPKRQSETPAAAEAEVR